MLLKNAGTDFLHVIAKEVSHRLNDEFDIGKEYYALQGKSILLPELPLFRRSRAKDSLHLFGSVQRATTGNRY